jgi:hypothetical protein
MTNQRFAFSVLASGLGIVCLPLFVIPARSTIAETPAGAEQPQIGPLRVLPANPRYFTDGSGRAVYLTGSHTWNDFQDMGEGDPPRAFDFEAYRAFLQGHGHNFIRLWRWEETAWDLKGNSAVEAGVKNVVAPHPWARTGPGTAIDGKPKFDLATFDPAYFQRLRTRVQAAEKRGIYVSVMLFEGWELHQEARSWNAHPLPTPTICGASAAAWTGFGGASLAATTRS